MSFLPLVSWRKLAVTAENCQTGCSDVGAYECSAYTPPYWRMSGKDTQNNSLYNIISYEIQFGTKHYQRKK